jgi:hypothetical protein
MSSLAGTGTGLDPGPDSETAWIRIRIKKQIGPGSRCIKIPGSKGMLTTSAAQAA